MSNLNLQRRALRQWTSARRTMVSGLAIGLLMAASVLHADDSARRDQAIRYLEQLRAETGAPGVSAAVGIQGKIAFSTGIGSADLEWNTRQTGATVHNIGSISKPIAAVGLMHLVERGKVDLDAEIQTYLPWFPRKERKITVRQLLTHTSGIGHYADMQVDKLPPESWFKHYDQFEESTRWWRDKPLAFTPGTHWGYTSFGASLIQAIVEKVSGEPFEDFLRKAVWEPAGMMATQFDVPTRVVSNRGHGYARNANTGQLENDENEDVSYKYAGGGMLSSDEDLIRFGQALNAGRLLRADTLKAMYRLQLSDLVEETPQNIARRPPGTSPPVGPRKQALMWFTSRDAGGRPFVYHSGIVKSTMSYLGNYYENDVVVALYVNCRCVKNLEAVGEEFARLFLQ